jgi:putative spermidine/putrescine transport system ATP-binding protein
MSVRAELHRVARTFADGTRGLQPTDLVLEPGTVTALLGPSGCGKTTLLRLLAGLARPDAGGRVLFDGRDVTDVPVERRNIGMVFQGYALFPHMTVARNIGYGLEARGVARPEREARVAEMLRLVRMEALANRRPDQLSGGQRQRVALARALAPAPALLLLDEPFGALDAALRLALRIELAQLLQELRVTAVIVTHDQAEAMALGDSVAVMEGGRIAQRGAPREVYEHPANLFVAGFVGTLNALGEGRFCRPEALRPDPDGALEACVTGAFFDAGRTRLHLAAPPGEWVVELGPGEPVPERGETLRLALDDQAVLRF